MTRKLLSVLFLAVLLGTVFFGCAASKDNAPLRICFDIGSNYDQSNGSSHLEQAVKAFLTDYDVFTKDYGWARSEEFEVEIIPSDAGSSTERATALQRIRTEIMTGGGPDVFVVNCQSSYLPASRDYSDCLESARLFPYPEKAMNSGLFLPLDDYIKNAEMTNWSSQQPQVMAGGRDREGNLVAVPMSFTLPVNIFRQKDLPGGVPKGGTWAQVMAGEDSALAPQALWLWAQGLSELPNLAFHTSGLPYVFPALADFEAGRVCFTEEELLNIVSQNIQACKRLDDENGLDNFAFFPDVEPLFFSYEMATFLGAETTQEDSPAVMVPMANLEGGATAKVSRYCAVNRNTARPLDAFRVVECLMHPAFQSNSEVERMKGLGNGIMPMDMSLLAPGAPVDGLCLSPQLFDEWRRACESITSVRFPSPLESEMEDMMNEIQQIMADSYEPDVEKYSGIRLIEFLNGDITDEQLREIVHQHYKRMCRLVDEAWHL